MNRANDGRAKDSHHRIEDPEPIYDPPVLRARNCNVGEPRDEVLECIVLLIFRGMARNYLVEELKQQVGKRLP